MDYGSAGAIGKPHHRARYDTRKSRAGSPPDVDRPLSLGSRSALRLVRKEAGHDWPPSSRDSAAEHAAADVPLGVTSLFQ